MSLAKKAKDITKQNNKKITQKIQKITSFEAQDPKFEGKTATHYCYKDENKNKSEAPGCYKAQRKYKVRRVKYKLVAKFKESAKCQKLSQSQVLHKP